MIKKKLIEKIETDQKCPLFLGQPGVRDFPATGQGEVAQLGQILKFNKKSGIQIEKQGRI